MIRSNTGDKEEGVEILYHMNMGYPLLDEDSVVEIPSVEVTPRDEHAAEDLANWKQMITPQAGYVERCYYHRFEGKEGRASSGSQNSARALRSHLTRSSWMALWNGR